MKFKSKAWIGGRGYRGYSGGTLTLRGSLDKSDDDDEFGSCDCMPGARAYL